MMVVGVMLYQGMPELNQQSGGDHIVLRSGPASETEDISAITKRAVALEEAHKLPEATEAYEGALDRIATPAANLASLYLQAGRNDEALALARFAADLRPFRAGILDTLAWAYDRTQNHEAALKIEERAAKLDPAFVPQLDALRKGNRR